LRPSAGIRNDTIACLTRWSIEDSLKIIFQSRLPGAPPTEAFGYQYQSRLFFRQDGQERIATFGPSKPFTSSQGCGSSGTNILCVNIPQGQVLSVLSDYFPANGSSYSYQGDEPCAATPEALPRPMELAVTAIDSMLGKYLISNDPRYTNFNTVRVEFTNISGSERAVGIWGSTATATRVLSISVCAERMLGLQGNPPGPDGC
jgi:hypothetical protein